MKDGGQLDPRVGAWFEGESRRAAPPELEAAVARMVAATAQRRRGAGFLLRARLAWPPRLGASARGLVVVAAVAVIVGFIGGRLSTPAGPGVEPGGGAVGTLSPVPSAAPPSASPSGGAATGAAPVFSPCLLLTDEEVQSALAVPVATPSRVSDDDCTWVAGKNDGLIYLELTVVSFDQVTWASLIAGDTEIAGIGGDAYLNMRDHPTVDLRDGALLVRVILKAPGHEADPQRAVLDLARLVDSRLSTVQPLQ